MYENSTDDTNIIFLVLGPWLALKPWGLIALKKLTQMELVARSFEFVFSYSGHIE